MSWTSVRGWETPDEQGLLAFIANLKGDVADTVIVEIGSEHGMSASIWLQYAPEARIYCVEINPDAQFLHNCANAGLNTNRLIWLKGSSLEIEIPKPFVENDMLIDILFVDGDHSFEGALQDLNRWSQYMAHNGVILVHDCACATNRNPHKMHYAVVSAVQHFLAAHSEWRVAFSVNTTMVLMRGK